ncbi:MAG: hypothetical protein JKY56_22825 [Kofleriaceae bacterium]|nr:hypothetical protein [Kofleriaceae bacterium]
MSIGPLQLLSSGRDGSLYVQSDGNLRVEMATGRGAELVRVSDAHREARKNFVETIDTGERWASFSSDGAISLLAIIDNIARGALPPLPYPVATAFIECLLDAIDTAHELGIPFGTIGQGNIVFTRLGEMKFLGLAGLRVSPQDYCTPEVALGDPATTGSDLYAGLQMVRYCLPVVDLPKSLRRIYSGNPRPAERYFWKQVIRIDGVLSSPNPQRRDVSVAVVRAVYHGFWRLVGIRPDHEALEQYARTAYRLLRPDTVSAKYDQQLSVMELSDGRRMELAKRPVQARLLAILVDAHLDMECDGLRSAELIERLWPGERISPESARNRLYVGISKLRKQGLGTLLEQDTEGRYRFVRGFVITKTREQE